MGLFVVDTNYCSWLNINANFSHVDLEAVKILLPVNLTISINENVHNKCMKLIRILWICCSMTALVDSCTTGLLGL